MCPWFINVSKYILPICNVGQYNTTFALIFWLAFASISSNFDLWFLLQSRIIFWRFESLESKSGLFSFNIKFLWLFWHLLAKELSLRESQSHCSIVIRYIRHFEGYTFCLCLSICNASFSCLMYDNDSSKNKCMASSKCVSRGFKLKGCFEISWIPWMFCLGGVQWNVYVSFKSVDKQDWWSLTISQLV